MSGKIFVWLLTTFLLTSAPAAEAQQPKKVPRIGYVGDVTPSLTRSASRHSVRVCGILVTSREKTLSLSSDMRRANSIGFPPRCRTRSSQGGRIVTADSTCDPCRQGSDQNDSHRHDAGSRSC